MMVALQLIVLMDYSQAETGGGGWTRTSDTTDMSRML
jgi:hypothetical protein